MTVSQSQISAYVSEDTKKRIEHYVTSHGLNKGHLIETALLHHLQALAELPADLILPPRLIVSEEGFEKVIECIENPQGPTEAMNALFDDKDI